MHPHQDLKINIFGLLVVICLPNSLGDSNTDAVSTVFSMEFYLLFSSV